MGIGCWRKKILWYSPFVPYLLDQEPLEFKMFMDRRRLTPVNGSNGIPILTVGCIAFIVWIGFRGYKFGKAQIFIYTHDGRNLKQSGQRVMLSQMNRQIQRWRLQEWSRKNWKNGFETVLLSIFLCEQYQLWRV